MINSFSSHNLTEHIPVEAQVEMWEKLSGEWDDPRPADVIAADGMEHRTVGRKVDF